MKRRRIPEKAVLYAFGLFATALFSFCSKPSPTALVPGLDQMEETPGTVGRPVLRATLPGSWDENWYASPAVYDIDGDGNNEIVSSRHSVLYVWKSDCTLLWRAPVGENAFSANDHGSFRMYCSPAVGDFNGDGFGEIAIAYDNKTAVYDHNGNLLPGWPQAFPGPDGEIRSLAVADVNGDGLCEIAVVKTGDGPVTHLWKLTGTAVAGWPQIGDRTDKEKNDYGGYNQNIGIVDLDGNGKKEIVCTYDICHIGIFNSDGSSVAANPLFKGKYACSVPMFHDINLAIQGWGADGNDRDEFTDSPPVFADIDGGGRFDIVLYADHEKAGEYLNRGNSLWVLNPDMTRVKGFERPITTGMPLYTGYENNIVQVAPAPCIIVTNGKTVIVAPSYDGNMYCYSNQGDILWKVQFDAAGGPFIGAGEAVAADLNNDGESEIVFTTYSPQNDCSNLVVLNAADGTLLHRIKISGRGSMAAPTIADVDNDGKLEIVVSLKDALGSGLGGVQIWDVASALKNRTDWPTGRGNFLRTGEHVGL